MEGVKGVNRVLRVGDSSVRVAEARATLARLGLLSDFTGELSAWKKQKYSETDKTFDADLAEVLKAFQQSRGILPTGEIDDLTLRELRQASYTLGSRVLSYEPTNPLVGDDISQLQQPDGRYVSHTNEKPCLRSRFPGERCPL